MSSVSRCLEILHRGRKWADFYNAGRKIWGYPPKNCRGHKHAKFGMIFDDFKLWRRMSPQQMKIFKVGQILDRSRFLPHSAKKFSELWSTSYRDLVVKSYPFKSTFWKTIFLPIGGAAPPIFTHVENEWCSLASTHSTKEIGPSTVFMEGVKNWLKIQWMSIYNFWGKGSSPTKLCHMTCH